MSFFARWFFVGIAFALPSMSAYADDVVAIRYLDGRPPPGQSTEWINLRIQRPSPPPVTSESTKQDVDLFFEQVSATLTQHGVDGDWQLAIFDAPAIEISIDIDGETLKLVSCHVSLERGGKYMVTEHGLRATSGKDRDTVLAEQSDRLRHHRSAFETILRLTLERTRARLSP